MTPLEFIISVKNSDAKTGLEEVRSQLNQFKNDAADMYEGPARESRIREEVRGIVKDVSLGKDPVYVFISALERMSEAMRFAGTAAIAVAVVTGITTSLYSARDATLKLIETYQKAMTGDVKNMTVEQLKETQKAVSDTDEQFKKASWVQWLMNGAVFRKIGQDTGPRGEEVNSELVARTNAEIEARTAMLRRSTDEELGMEDEIANTRRDLQQKADEQRAQGNEAGAQDYEAQMSAAIDRITEKFRRAEAERFAHQREMIRDLEKAQADEAIGPDRLTSLKAQRDALLAKIAGDAPGFEDPSQTRVKDERELAEIQRQIHEEEAKASKDAAEAQERADDKAVEAAEKTTRLRQEAAKAEFENLSREEKLAVLRAEQATIQKEMSRSVYSSDAQLAMAKNLAEVRKAINELSKDSYIWRGVSAETALTGSMSSAAFGRVTNDPANRAEKQRDTMVQLLTKIANGKGGLTGAELDVF